MEFTKAIKAKKKLRLALMGPSGSGKTYSALAIATGLIDSGQRIAVLDTEHESASMYADKFDFDALSLDSFSVENYIAAIGAAARASYGAMVIDSLSHAWAGKDGLLEYKDEVSRRNKGDSFGAWREATPKHNQLVEAMLACPMHLIVTMRTKTEYVVEKDERGKNVPRKVGMQPIQRDGLEYEFDVVGDMDLEHRLTIAKTRIDIVDGRSYIKPNGEFSRLVRDWLADGAVPQARPGAAAAQQAAPAAPVAPDTRLLLRSVTEHRKRLGWTPELMGAYIRREFAKDGQALDAAELAALVTMLANMTPARTSGDLADNLPL